jgi:hypothetical protein
MPALAREQSRAGAKAFVRHYIELINYAWASGRTDELKALAAASCAVCRKSALSIEHVFTAGGSKTDGEWSVSAIAVLPTEPLQQPVVDAAISIAAGSLKESASSAPVSIQPSSSHLTFRLEWKDGWVARTWTAA